MSITKVPLLNDLQGAWGSLQIECISSSGSETVTLRDAYPFQSVTDTKRMLWCMRDGDPRWAPQHVFLAVRSAEGMRPLEFHWTEKYLPDPVPLENRRPSSLLVDSVGNRKPVTPTMIGGLTLEAALAPELVATNTIPSLVAISLDALRPADVTEISHQLFVGFYILYYPWLSEAYQIMRSATPSDTLSAEYAAAFPYMEERTGRIQTVQRALATGVGGTSATMNTVVYMQWTLPPPPMKPESLERTFYELTATPTIPFLRYFPAGGKSAPLLKLALKPDGSPVIDDPRVFKQYINQPAPAIKSAVILARIPITSPHVERGAAFTFHLFEDGTCDISLEVPQRGVTYAAVVAAEAERVLGSVVTALGFPAETRPMLRGLHATYIWTHPDPKRSQPLSALRLKERVAALTPFLAEVPKVEGDRAMAVFAWSATSNYETETAQFAFITQLLQRADVEKDPSVIKVYYETELAKRFGISREAAASVIERWIERRGEAVAPAAGPGAGSLAVARHSIGVNISIGGAHPTYQIELQGVDSLVELQRILSVLGVMMGAKSTEFRLTAPVQEVLEVAAVVEANDDIIQSAAEGNGLLSGGDDYGAQEMTEEMMAELAMLEGGMFSFGDGEATMGDEVTSGFAAGGEAMGMTAGATRDGGLSTTTAPAPSIAAAAGGGGQNVNEPVLAELEAECHSNPWKPGEPSLTLAKDYYMAKLKKEDKVMFDFSVDKPGGDLTGYSRSCQRGPGRQPNILTAAEYARVKRCYENQVRFVELPPKKPEDLPKVPNYKPSKTYKYEDFLVDPETGKPMWTVYGYNNMSRAGDRSYLICPELWCERDNIPLLRSEFEGTQGRGFTKAPNTCAFCGGRVIQNLLSPKQGESVIVRTYKAGDKTPVYIGTIKKDKLVHPDGITLLPCCYASIKFLKKYIDAAYKGTIVYGDAMADDEEDEDLQVAIADQASVSTKPQMIDTRPTVDYERTLSTMQMHYVLGQDKQLDAGKIGLLPTDIDEFFGQVSSRSVEKVGINPKFVRGANLFVLLGVDSRRSAPGLNLYAGLAPLLGFNSAEETMREIMGRRMVRAFESANYGTLVHEFAARSTLTDAQITASLQQFATENGYELGPARGHVTRLYKAWTAFLTYLADPNEPKQIRHIAHLLAQPGVILPTGLLLAVLVQTESGVQVVCPPFGIPPASLFGSIPVAFLWHDKRNNTYQPIILYNGTQQAVKFFNEHGPEMGSLPRKVRVSIQRWLRDWRSASLGCGRPAPPPHVWTPDRDTSSLPRLSSLRRAIGGYSPVSIVRDRSNRLAGVIFRRGDVSLFVPCLDDGFLAPEYPRIYEAEMIPLSPVERYLEFYPQVEGLRPVAQLAHLGAEGSQIIGLRLDTGTMIPVAPVPLTSANPALPVEQVDEFPWERDSILMRDPAAQTMRSSLIEESTASVSDQLSEAYQYLRLSFGRWLHGAEGGAALRKDITKLMTSKLPLFEKRKRLDIRLEPLIIQWIRPEQTEERRPMSLLREDCLTIRSEDKCSAAGSCTWSGGRCLIHAPYRTEGTSPIRIFTARLSDELLRYSSERREIFDNDVPMIRTPKGVVRVGNELYLATRQKDTADRIMTQLGFTGHMATAYPEELLRLDEEEDVVQEALPEVEEINPMVAELPRSWVEKGMKVPQPVGDPEEIRRLVFAEATGIPIPKWEEGIRKRRVDLKLPGDVGRPFQWSLQDFYAIAYIFGINILFVRPGLTLDAWIAPPSASKVMTDKPLFMIFWGPGQLLVSGPRKYRFYSTDLPTDLIELLERSQPIPEDVVRGDIDTIPVQQTAPSRQLPQSSAVIPQTAPQPVATNLFGGLSVKQPSGAVIPQTASSRQLPQSSAVIPVDSAAVIPQTFTVIPVDSSTVIPQEAPTMTSDKGQPPPPAPAPTN